MKSYPSLNSDTGCSNGWSSICDLFVAWALDVRDLLFLHSYIGRTPFSYPCVLCKKSASYTRENTVYIYIYTVEPVKLNTCVHWKKIHVPAHSHWKSMGGYLDTLNTCPPWTLNTTFVPTGQINLSTLNILHWFETFHWEWGQMRYIR